MHSHRLLAHIHTCKSCRWTGRVMVHDRATCHDSDDWEICLDRDVQEIYHDPFGLVTWTANGYLLQVKRGTW